jgi:hypothetical protein
VVIDHGIKMWSKVEKAQYDKVCSTHTHTIKLVLALKRGVKPKVLSVFSA